MEKVWVNPGDREYDNSLYQVSLYNYDPFVYLVFANHEQDALDQVVDYLETENEMGYFVDGDDYEEDEVFTAGNHS